MQYEIGKVIKYDNYTGEILSSSGRYLFLEEDIKIKEINLEELVIFRPEEINGQRRAFYIQNLENILKDKNKRNKILKKINLLISE